MEFSNRIGGNGECDGLRTNPLHIILRKKKKVVFPKTRFRKDTEFKE